MSLRVLFLVIWKLYICSYVFHTFCRGVLYLVVFDSVQVLRHYFFIILSICYIYNSKPSFYVPLQMQKHTPFVPSSPLFVIFTLFRSVRDLCLYSSFDGDSNKDLQKL
ncbi:hypothetical protein QVD17_27112 [Tagetes erecta]|uniref:Uncharacterized protein n=1 Tax=Tagetes erecta TaxID=13708 RepID=A0AAD8NRE7_TARER|nr:hypothetical protein QVD17_27112 [Tagetes erecta]